MEGGGGGGGKEERMSFVSSVFAPRFAPRAKERERRRRREKKALLSHQSGDRDDVGDALHALAEHVVGEQEGVGEGSRVADNAQETREV